MAQNENPLIKYYRNAKLSIALPSRGKYYAEGVLDLDDEGELAIYPMTAQDEITLQNPDALLTGQAVVDVIKSCVPGVLKPRNLLACDIDVLMIATRVASYGEEANMEINCVECGESNTYSLSLDTLLSQTETLDEHYEVVLDNALTVFIKPGSFEAMVRQQKAAFENSKLEDAIRTPEMSEEQRIKILSRVFEQMAKLNFDLINESVSSVVFTQETDGGDEIVTIDNKTHIAEWLQNVDKATVDKLEEKILDVNKVGIAKTVPATCKECDHKWEARIEFNPVNFS